MRTTTHPTFLSRSASSLMCFLKFKWVMFAGAGVGILVPTAFMLAAKYGHYLFGTRFDLCLWPTAVMLIGTESHGHDFYSLALLSCSIVLNILYYLLIAALVWCIVRVLLAGLSLLRR